MSDRGFKDKTGNMLDVQGSINRKLNNFTNDIDQRQQVPTSRHQFPVEMNPAIETGNKVCGCALLSRETLHP